MDKQLYFSLFFTLILTVSCAGKTGGKGNDSNETSDAPQIQPVQPVEPVAPVTPYEPDYQLENAEREGSNISLNSFRYRNVFPDYNAGIATIELPKKTTIEMTEDDIKLFVRVDVNDLSRVQDGSIEQSNNFWSELSFVSQTSGDIVKICVRIQPKKFQITEPGVSELKFLAKAVYTALGDKNCVGISANGVDVFEGIVSNYLVVDGGTKISAETKNDFKTTARVDGKKQRVGAQVQYNFSFTE